jgi:hypothetical protein
MDNSSNLCLLIPESDHELPVTLPAIRSSPLVCVSPTSSPTWQQMHCWSRQQSSSNHHHHSSKVLWLTWSF